MPTNYGGMGLVGTLSVDSNVSGPDNVAGVSTLCAISEAGGSLEEVVSNILNQPLEEISPMDFMRSPAQYRVVGPRLRAMRTRAVCIRIAKEKAVNPMLKRLLDTSAAIDMEELSRNLSKLKIVTRQMIESVYNSSRLAKVDSVLGKFQEADCVINLIGYDMLNKLRYSARSDVRGIYHSLPYRERGEDIPNIPRGAKYLDEGE